MWCPMAWRTSARMQASTHTTHTHSFSKETAASIFYPEDAVDTVLQNTGSYLPHYTVTYQKTVFF
jgi:hypothetical protein